MNIWTYRLSFEIHGERWLIEVPTTFTLLTTRLCRGEDVVDEQTSVVTDGLETWVHTAGLDNADGTSSELRVEVGYFNWLSIGIRVFLDDEMVYESHPGRDIRFGEKRFGVSGDRAAKQRERVSQWNRNKYSIAADVALGLVFFAVGKITGDLALAAIVGSFAGLALVVVQKFVKVDLLGGFAVFGTLMMVVSAGFSLAFQSEYMVQMKGTIFGVLGAALFLGDGVLRKGAYFGVRMQRYLPGTVDPARLASGLGIGGLALAAINYAVATWSSEDAWLTFTTFVETPLSIGLGYAAWFWAMQGRPARVPVTEDDEER